MCSSFHPDEIKKAFPLRLMLIMSRKQLRYSNGHKNWVTNIIKKITLIFVCLYQFRQSIVNIFFSLQKTADAMMQNIVACRPVAGKLPRDKQICKSRN
jgi:hypothetical protein